MEYIKLLLGIGMIIGFVWILYQNRNRSGLVNALFRIDNVIIIIVGFYLIITAVYSLAL
ncbi:hypothetical protein [Catalinimonas niigatensis]|uniref:hypothetical protein n=1 Tax=Catalinimonas niigatensis TaxID=1397264 RepID=UPI00266614E7|nr:hypothetical protein [Catalinimonas niigatensis]WPP52688.1 hypothetical protein PZB72_09880 [Catalinimonas niigatensis]